MARWLGQLERSCQYCRRWRKRYGGMEVWKGKLTWSHQAEGGSGRAGSVNPDADRTEKAQKGLGNSRCGIRIGSSQAQVQRMFGPDRATAIQAGAGNGASGEERMERSARREGRGKGKRCWFKMR